MYKTHASKDELNDLLAEVIDIIHLEHTRYPGLSYEQGIRDALEWVLGDAEELEL